MEKKFTLTDETMQFEGKTLYRIKALKSFGNVKKYDLGGWVESEDNLSQYGNCWIYNEAKVMDNALVHEDAQVSGHAEISDEASIFGTSWVWHNAKISGKAEIYENANIGGYVKICGHIRVANDSRIYGESKFNGDTIICNLHTS